jgi:hypothetical protein
MRSKGINGKPYKRHCLTLQPWDVKFKSIVVRKKKIVVNPLILTIIVLEKWPTTQLVDGHQQSSCLLNYQNTFACVQNCHYKEFAPFTPIFLSQQNATTIPTIIRFAMVITLWNVFQNIKPSSLKWTTMTLMSW